MKKRILFVVVAFAAVMASALTACGPSAAEKKQREEAERVRVQDSIAKARAEAERVAAAQAKALEDSLKQEAKKFVTRFYGNINVYKCDSITPMLTVDFVKVFERAKVANGQQRADTEVYAGEGFSEYMDGSYWGLKEIKCNLKIGKVELANADSATVACVYTQTYLWYKFSGVDDYKETFRDSVKLVRKEGTWKIYDVIRRGKSLKKLWTKEPDILEMNGQYV